MRSSCRIRDRRRCAYGNSDRRRRRVPRRSWLRVNWFTFDGAIDVSCAISNSRRTRHGLRAVRRISPPSVSGCDPGCHRFCGGLEFVAPRSSAARISLGLGRAAKIVAYLTDCIMFAGAPQAGSDVGIFASVISTTLAMFVRRRPTGNGWNSIATASVDTSDSAKSSPLLEVRIVRLTLRSIPLLIHHRGTRRRRRSRRLQTD